MEGVILFTKINSIQCNKGNVLWSIYHQTPFYKLWKLHNPLYKIIHKCYKTETHTIMLQLYNSFSKLIHTCYTLVTIQKLFLLLTVNFSLRTFRARWHAVSTCTILEQWQNKMWLLFNCYLVWLVTCACLQ